DIEKNLVEYGFSENEARIYVVLAENIELSVFDIAKKSGIPRATVYITLQKMEKKGFISSFRKNRVLHYTNESFNTLTRIAESKKQIALEKIIPDLQSIAGTDRHRPTVKMLTGKEGIKKSFEDIIE